VDIEPRPAPPLVPVPAGPDAPPAAGAGYQVHTELTIALANFGIPSRLRVVGHTQFGPAFDIAAFKVHTTIGDGHVEVHGDSASQKLTVDFEIGGYHDRRLFDYQQLRGAGLQSLIGMAGLANLGMLSGAGVAEALPPSALGAPATGKKLTTVRTSRLRIAGETEETYLIETRLDESLWAKVWISKQGEVLKVDTSLRVTLLADTLTEIQSRYPDEPTNDSH
jgi:hypothetical protein